MNIKTGSGSNANGDVYYWARSGEWLVRRYPFTGGVEFHVNIMEIGWTVDVFGDMPEAISMALCDAAGVPADVSAIIHDVEGVSSCN